MTKKKHLKTVPKRKASLMELPVATSLPLNPDKVLGAAIGKVTAVAVIGYDKEGQEYFATNLAEAPDLLWLLRRFESIVVNEGDRTL